MRAKISYLLFFFFLVASIPFASYGNINTKTYCRELIGSAKQEYLERNYVKSLEIFTKALPIAKENEFIELEALILNFMGLVYKDLLAYDKAMECFIEVYNLAFKSSNLKAQISALSNMTLIYGENDEHDKSLEYLKKAYTISLELGDSIKIGEIAINIAYVALEVEDIALAEQYINIAKNIRTDDNRFLIKTQLVIITFLISKKDYAVAESMALHILQQEIEPINEIRLYYLLSKIYQEKGNLNKAIQYNHEIIQGKSTIREKIGAYGQLSELYQQSNSFALALQCKDSLVQIKDAWYKVNIKQYTETSRMQIELLNSEKELTENKAKQKVERILFIVGFIAIFVLAIISIWVSRIQSIKSKQQKIIIEKEQRITKLELDKEKNKKLLLKRQLKEQETLSLLEQERLSNENKQLAAKVLMQSNRNELIENIIHSLSQISRQPEDHQLQLVIEQLKMQLKESAEWDNFLTYFEQINPSFLSSLKQTHPDLTIVDIRFLSYMFLNFNTKEISSLLNISIDTCKKKRQRLAAKLGLETTELYNYLLTIG